ncbi:MAG: glycosyltransferase family 2 protein [Candidatus Aminicenantia bacterium]
MKISACIITYNEEDRIEDALKSLEGVVDEIVVVDAFSSDRTPEIVKFYTVKFFKREWSDYSIQKNFAISQTQYPWILSIDADERLSEELRKELLELKKIEPEVDGFSFRRKTFYLGKWIKHSGWYPDKKVRLFRKDTAFWKGDFVHETLVFKGKVKELKGELLHYSYRDISDHISRIQKYATLASKKMSQEGKRSSYLKILFLPFFTFLRHFILKKGILDGIQGLLISLFSSYYVFLKFTLLYELSKEKC